MSADRIQALEALARRRPDDPRLKFGLALEYLNAGRRADGIVALQEYLDSADDEGNAWGRLAEALREEGRDEEAREAYRSGVQAALAHGHPTMAEEFQGILEDWDR
jgi:predicted Zn-dependent protease